MPQKKTRLLKQTNFAQPNKTTVEACLIYYWYANVRMCPNELRMKSTCPKIHQGISDHIKVNLEPFFLWKHQIALNNHKIVIKTNRSNCLMTKSLRKLFLWKVFTFLGFLEFFVRKDLVFGSGHWTFSDRLF